MGIVHLLGPLPPVKIPVRFDEKDTVVPSSGFVPPVFVTVAVQVVGAFTATGAGEHVTVVVVGSLVAAARTSGGEKAMRKTDSRRRVKRRVRCRLRMVKDLGVPGGAPVSVRRMLLMASP